ncbi:MAG: isoleucine--tRNA ligase [Candidatus Marinimicrobia bacterium]|nr:isoleucine--tRNA ligase [Candidatus Neomarinimicrobiota bacterium]|tara:strand:- start:4630 stop:7773 length:3144 start_codon:yes stop_codon:yes gene_type:complete
MFKRVDANINLPLVEAEMSAYWDKINAFETSMKNRKNDKTFRFYDGPPFPTGSPHYGNLLAGVIKDIVPRYWTMRGYYVERRFGWDVHGLPIEMEVQKKLNLEDPQQIDEYGIDKFNEACRSQVQTNTDNWEKITRKIGRWVDFENDYNTMDIDFMESVWWVFKELWSKGLIYQDYKVLPYSWAASTPLSNFEANMDYRDVEDPSIYFTLDARNDFKNVVKGDKFLVWTTTPWCIPGNLAIAIGKEIEYSRILLKNNFYWIATDRLFEMSDYEIEIVDISYGEDLIGATYIPAYAEYEHLFKDGAFRIIHSDDTNTESGSGLVSQAPAYGESDFYALKNAKIDVIADPVTLSGRFDKTFKELYGLNVKDADNLIMDQLEERGNLFSKTTEMHSYPFCWRTGTPLIYKAIPTWFVSVEKIRDRMVELNQSTHWVPGFIGEKRFSNWLGNARDWAISRNRYWGSCIPVWINVDDPEDMLCIGSVEELEKLSGQKVTDLHRHYLDDLDIEINGKTYKRTSEVLDCWFESGSMPYGQQHYPFENEENFFDGFPADFIAEGLDQTRGWFYTLTVLAVALFDSVAFKNCITTGMILAEDGRKMSKSLKNYPDPEELLNSYGGDSLRAYLINSPVVRGEPLKFSEEGVKLVTRNIILPLWNSFSFFSTYANADDITLKDLEKASPLNERPMMDRWIISSMQSLIKTVNEKMENYYLYEVIPPLMNFVDELTNWYVRSNRKRFWKEKDENDIDKINAFKTLHEVLLEFSKSMAPVLPFICEKIYQGLIDEEDQSIHYCDYPLANESLIDNELENNIELAKNVIKSVRNLRVKLKLPNKQPLNSVKIITKDKEIEKKLIVISDLIKNEVNIKEVLFDFDVDNWINYEFKPNFKILGPKLGQQMNKVSKYLKNVDKITCDNILQGDGVVIDGIKISSEEIDVIFNKKEDNENQDIVDDFSLVLDTSLDDNLIMERFSRELVSAIQKLRKDTGLDVIDRIILSITSNDDFVKETLRIHKNYVKNETLAVELNFKEKNTKDMIFNKNVSLDIKKLTNDS